MRTPLLPAFAVVLTLAAPCSANAALIGPGDTIYPIQDVKAVGAKNEPLFLAYRTSHYSILAGVYLKNEGYVLGVKADHDRYYDMPEGDELKRYQARGLLPDPLPAYSVGMVTYAMGYSLWALLAVLLGGCLAAFVLLRKKVSAPTDAVTVATGKEKGDVSPAFGLLLALFRKRQAKGDAIASP